MQDASPSTTPATPAPEQPSQPAQPAPRRALTTAEIVAKLSSKVEDRKAAEAAPEPAPAASPEPKAATDAPAAEAPKPTSEATRLSQAILKAQKLEAELLSGKKSLETVQKQFAELSAKLEAASKDPVAALKLANYDPIKLAEEMRDGKLKADRLPTVELPDDAKEALEFVKTEKARREQEAQKAERDSVRSQNLEYVKAQLGEVGADFPVLAAMPNMADQLLGVIESSADPGSLDSEGFRDLCSKAQAHVLSEAKTLLTNGASLKALLSDESVKAAVVEALGLAKKPDERTEPATVPTERATGEATDVQPGKRVMRTLTQRASAQIPTRTKGASSAELAAKINAQILGK